MAQWVCRLEGHLGLFRVGQLVEVQWWESSRFEVHSVPESSSGSELAAQIEQLCLGGLGAHSQRQACWAQSQERFDRLVAGWKVHEARQVTLVV